MHSGYYPIQQRTRCRKPCKSSYFMHWISHKGHTKAKHILILLPLYNHSYCWLLVLFWGRIRRWENKIKNKIGILGRLCWHPHCEGVIWGGLDHFLTEIVPFPDCSQITSKRPNYCPRYMPFYVWRWLGRKWSWTNGKGRNCVVVDFLAVSEASMAKFWPTPDSRRSIYNQILTYSWQHAKYPWPNSDLLLTAGEVSMAKFWPTPGSRRSIHGRALTYYGQQAKHPWHNSDLLLTAREVSMAKFWPTPGSKRGIHGQISTYSWP